MTRLFLTDEQADTIRKASGTVEMLDSNGVVLAYANPASEWTEEQISEALRRMESDEPCYTTGEVLDYLRSLPQR